MESAEQFTIHYSPLLNPLLSDINMSFRVGALMGPYSRNLSGSEGLVSGRRSYCFCCSKTSPLTKILAPKRKPIAMASLGRAS